MTNKISKSAFAIMLMAGLLLTSFAPSAMAQGNCRTRNRNTRNVNYDRNRDYNYDRNRDSDYQRNRDYEYDRRNQSSNYDPNYDPYYNRDTRNTRGLKRTGIGAAIGAAGGGLLGGRKGVLIGGLAGAAGGYIYHRSKENNRRY